MFVEGGAIVCLTKDGMYHRRRIKLTGNVVREVCERC
jgi:hypothetical protein